MGGADEVKVTEVEGEAGRILVGGVDEGEGRGGEVAGVKVGEGNEVKGGRVDEVARRGRTR